MIRKILGTFIWSIPFYTGLLIHESTEGLIIWIGWSIAFFAGLEIIDIWKKELQQFKVWLWKPISKG